MDFQFLHFKYYEEEVPDPKTGKVRPMVSYARCSTAWKQRIGLFSSSLMNMETLDQIKKRIKKEADEVTQSGVMTNELEKLKV